MEVVAGTVKIGAHASSKGASPRISLRCGNLCDVECDESPRKRGRRKSPPLLTSQSLRSAGIEILANNFSLKVHTAGSLAALLRQRPPEVVAGPMLALPDAATQSRELCAYPERCVQAPSFDAARADDDFDLVSQQLHPVSDSCECELDLINGGSWNSIMDMP